MTDSIFIVFPGKDEIPAEGRINRQPKESEIRNSLPKLLYKKFVNLDIGTLADKLIRYDKVIVIKEENATNLKDRFHEILKYEDTRRVLFAVFTTKIDAQTVCQIFEEKAKPMFKKKKVSHGRIWSVDVNGSELACGIVAADCKIKIWHQINDD